MIAASLFLLIAIWFNREDMKMLLLTVVVGLSYFLPTQLIANRDTWYFACIVSELVVLMFALNLRVAASPIIASLISMMLLGHITGWFSQGFTSGTIYYIVTNYLEYLELITCIIFSDPIVNKITERIKLCLN